MYILYIDESGNEHDPTDRHFILGGVAVYERATYFLSEQLEEIQNKYFHGLPPIPFHTSKIRAGKEFWRNIDSEVRQTVLQEIAEAISGVREPGVVLFAAIIEKTGTIHGEVAVKLATEYICRGFDIFLMKRYTEGRVAQRGLIIFSEGNYHKRAKIWVKEFRELGTEWGVLKNLCDIPYFANMRETRLLQAADFVSHATFRLYEKGDPVLIRPILQTFDQKDNVIYGIDHYLADVADKGSCNCPACTSRRAPGDFGSWV